MTQQTTISDVSIDDVVIDFEEEVEAKYLMHPCDDQPI